MIADIFGMDGIVVLVVVMVVLFGGSQIPKLARSLGSARKEFDHALREHDERNEPSVSPVLEPAKEVVTGEVVGRDDLTRKSA